jgi:hypothetical protein
MVSGDGDGWIQPEQWRGTCFCCLMFIDRFDPLVGEKMFRAMWLLNMTFCHLFVEDENSAIVGSKKSPKWSLLFLLLWSCRWPVVCMFLVKKHSEIHITNDIFWKNNLQKFFTMFQKCYMTNYWRISMVIFFSQGDLPKSPGFSLHGTVVWDILTMLWNMFYSHLPSKSPLCHEQITDWWWLEPWNLEWLSIYWECHHHNWRCKYFWEGLGSNHQPVKQNVNKVSLHREMMSKALHM